MQPTHRTFPSPEAGPGAVLSTARYALAYSIGVPMKILIAVDSSPSSKEALRQVAARIWPAGTAAVVLSVVDIGFLGGLIDSGPLLNSMTEAAEQLVTADAQLLAASDLSTTTAVTVGHPSSSIVEYARQWQSDFIYLGSHGRRGLTRFLLGSVSKAVVHSAGCSVGIIRDQASAGPGPGTGLGLALAPVPGPSEACECCWQPTDPTARLRLHVL